jgi:hypothetical protein
MHKTHDHDAPAAEPAKTPGEVLADTAEVSAREKATLGNHPELARRLYTAVASYRGGVSYATMEKRLAETNEKIAPVWGVIADKINQKINDAMAANLLGLFDEK